ncbi:MAG TPA: hypothetical protein DDW52_11140 [Planctomycetaceae bacterium]|nr:hypothetical protein [Planctomycetaceae bacterium]
MQAEVSFNGRKSARVVTDDAIRIAEEKFSRHSIAVDRIHLEVTDVTGQIPGPQHGRLTVFVDSRTPQVFEATSKGYVALLSKLFESASSELVAEPHKLPQTV